jgi:hypothetical protein
MDFILARRKSTKTKSIMQVVLSLTRTARMPFSTYSFWHVYGMNGAQNPFHLNTKLRKSDEKSERVYHLEHCYGDHHLNNISADHLRLPTSFLEKS